MSNLELSKMNIVTQKMIESVKGGKFKVKWNHFINSPTDILIVFQTKGSETHIILQDGRFLTCLISHLTQLPRNEISAIFQAAKKRILDEEAEAKRDYENKFLDFIGIKVDS
jgi:hypothetical protein